MKRKLRSKHYNDLVGGITTEEQLQHSIECMYARGLTTEEIIDILAVDSAFAKHEHAMQMSLSQVEYEIRDGRLYSVAGKCFFDELIDPPADRRSPSYRPMPPEALENLRLAQKLLLSGATDRLLVLSPAAQFAPEGGKPKDVGYQMVRIGNKIIVTCSDHSANAAQSRKELALLGLIDPPRGNLAASGGVFHIERSSSPTRQEFAAAIRAAGNEDLARAYEKAIYLGGNISPAEYQKRLIQQERQNIYKALALAGADPAKSPLEALRIATQVVDRELRQIKTSLEAVRNNATASKREWVREEIHHRTASVPLHKSLQNFAFRETQKLDSTPATSSRFRSPEFLSSMPSPRASISRESSASRISTEPVSQSSSPLQRPDRPIRIQLEGDRLGSKQEALRAEPRGGERFPDAVTDRIRFESDPLYRFIKSTGQPIYVGAPSAFERSTPILHNDKFRLTTDRMFDQRWKEAFFSRPSLTHRSTEYSAPPLASTFRKELSSHFKNEQKTERAQRILNQSLPSTIDSSQQKLRHPIRDTHHLKTRPIQIKDSHHSLERGTGKHVLTAPRRSESSTEQSSRRTLAERARSLAGTRPPAAAAPRSSSQTSRSRGGIIHRVNLVKSIPSNGRESAPAEQKHASLRAELTKRARLAIEGIKEKLSRIRIEIEKKTTALRQRPLPSEIKTPKQRSTSPEDRSHLQSRPRHLSREAHRLLRTIEAGHQPRNLDKSVRARVRLLLESQNSTTSILSSLRRTALFQRLGEIRTRLEQKLTSLDHADRRIEARLARLARLYRLSPGVDKSEILKRCRERLQTRIDSVRTTQKALFSIIRPRRTLLNRLPVRDTKIPHDFLKLRRELILSRAALRVALRSRNSDGGSDQKSLEIVRKRLTRLLSIVHRQHGSLTEYRASRMLRLFMELQASPLLSREKLRDLAMLIEDELYDTKHLFSKFRAHGRGRGKKAALRITQSSHRDDSDTPPAKRPQKKTPSAASARSSRRTLNARTGREVRSASETPKTQLDIVQSKESGDGAESEVH